MNDRTIGTCSICGGAVTLPTFWWGVVPPTPECSKCGAHPKRAYGPTIEMEPAQQPMVTYSGNLDRLTRKKP